MNVKPGDLAIIIKSRDGRNISKTCKVIENSYPHHPSGLPAWHVEMLSTGVGFDFTGRRVEFPAGQIVNFPDSWLKPISGIPDNEEIQDEKPIKETA